MMQHAAFSDIKLTKKQTLSPGLMSPMFVVSVVDWPLCSGAERFVSCGVRLKVLAAAGVNKICDAALGELFLTVKL